ncbi:HD domain-containing protein, partial [Salmonella enterica]|uniref:HD domain-containing protein n=1 Tax=Salmonella enterica TaxID=28901 RepID=UPI003F4C2111
LGEASGGDVPAIAQDGSPDTARRERADLVTLLAPLPPALQQEFLGLWDEYDAAPSPEARAAKALDKLETLIQH